MGLGVAKSARTLLENPFWQRALPVLAVVLSFNVLVKLDLIQEQFPFVVRCQYAFHRALAAVYPRELKAHVVKAIEIDTALHLQLGEPATIADNAHRTVACLDEPDGRLDDPSQDDLDVEIGADGHDRLEEGIDAVPRGENRLEPGLKLSQELVEAQARELRPRLSCCHRDSRG